MTACRMPTSLPGESKIDAIQLQQVPIPDSLITNLKIHVRKTLTRFDKFIENNLRCNCSMLFRIHILRKQACTVKM